MNLGVINNNDIWRLVTDSTRTDQICYYLFSNISIILKFSRYFPLLVLLLDLVIIETFTVCNVQQEFETSVDLSLAIGTTVPYISPTSLLCPIYHRNYYCTLYITAITNASAIRLSATLGQSSCDLLRISVLRDTLFAISSFFY